MDISNKKTFLDYLYHWEETRPDQVFLKQPFGDTTIDITWSETANQVRRMANFIKSKNLPEKTNIGLVSKNCAEWLIADMAIMMSGHVSVPFYATLTADQINQVLTHSDCKWLFVGKLDDWESMKPGIPSDMNCISFPRYNADKDHHQWETIIKETDRLEENHYPNLEDLFTIIYTSGTTGNPKGVMMQYKTMAESIYSTRSLTKLDVPNIRFFSYLPLSHIAERNLVEAGSVYSGGTVYFADTLATFADNLRAASPTHFLAVPRIWTKFQLGVLAKMPQKKLSMLMSIPIIGGIVKKKLKTGLGLADAIFILTGAAPMPASLIKWYRKIGIIIQEAYGMTENNGAVSMMPKGNIKDGTVGQIYPGMEVRIAPENGEILTRSKWNMLGYYKEPDITASTLDSDDWIHTGDVGELDNENFLKITGRVKEMYKTSKGEYIAPAQIEFGFADNDMIEQVCVVGQSLPQPIALVVLSEIGHKASKEQVEASLSENLKDLNPKLKSYERMNKIVVLKDEWNVENNCLTPTLKIKRLIIEKKFDSRFEPWFETKGSVIWE